MIEFNEQIRSELTRILDGQRIRFPENEVIRIDLHCHDHNSNVPDEILGRILNVPETWLPTEKLVSKLWNNGMDAVTITNHNNARSCFDLLDKGIDILVGAEFSCFVPDFKVGIHVLTYGFSPLQEEKLNKLRKNLYAFLEYTAAENIPTIWAHPLYHYKATGRPGLSFFDNMALLFERFEIINGQRDSWQNLLVARWVESLTEDRILELSESTGINPAQFCRNPYRKSVTGGSDSHMGIFCGATGTIIHIPDLEEDKYRKPLSELVLSGLRNGTTVPFGNHQNSERMMITFLDYVCQIALFGKDPGLIRIMLHKGSLSDKILSLLVSNGFAELRRHKVTMEFIRMFHKSLSGEEPHFSKRWFLPKAYKPVFDEVRNLAGFFREGKCPEPEGYKQSLRNIYSQLMAVLMARLQEKLEGIRQGMDANLEFEEFLQRLEIPSEIRSYLEDGTIPAQDKEAAMKTPDIKGFLDGLSFPFLASSVIMSAGFTSKHVLYKSRDLLKEFSRRLNYLEHPKRMLWLTDTFGDQNGVSMVLRSMLTYIQEHDLPVDILTCNSQLQQEDHLIVVKPMAEFRVPFYKEQVLRIPDLMELDELFQSGGYDRLMVSTEGPLGLTALYLKFAYTVPAYFYLHTDWITFAKTVLRFDKVNADRLKRLARLYYKSFDKLFVLNKDQQRWLTGRNMEFPEQSVVLTAHWAEAVFRPFHVERNEVLPFTVNDKVLLFTGRLSHEKGIMELPVLFRELQKKLPGLKLVIAGSGPAEAELRSVLPDAHYLGWINREALAKVYSVSDLLILPSKFDTFSCTVLEALNCGLPVVTYRTKGPKDIIQDGVNGYLVRTTEEMINSVYTYFTEPELHKAFRRAGIRRAREFRPDRIMGELLEEVELQEKGGTDYNISAYE